MQHNLMIKHAFFISVIFVCIIACNGFATPSIQRHLPNIEGSIFFEGLDINTDIYSINADGTNDTRLTNSSRSSYDPDLSPDGMHIAFASLRDNNSEIYIMDTNGENQQRLTNDPAEDKNPVWSPDGSKIAYHSYRNGKWQIYLMNADGSNQVHLTDGEYPDWSPDSSKIIFDSNRDGEYSQIFVIDADGEKLTLLTDEPAQSYRAVWSPDGVHIAFHSNRDDPYSNGCLVRKGGCMWGIYIMDNDGSNVTRLTLEQGVIGPLPIWSPDSRMIAFDSLRDGNQEIYIANADGTNLTRLTNNPKFDSPVWSPDGMHIAFVSERNNNIEIYIMDSDGTNVTRLTYNDVHEGNLSWRT